MGFGSELFDLATPLVVFFVNCKDFLGLPRGGFFMTVVMPLLSAGEVLREDDCTNFVGLWSTIECTPLAANPSGLSVSPGMVLL